MFFTENVRQRGRKLVHHISNEREPLADTCRHQWGCHSNDDADQASTYLSSQQEAVLHRQQRLDSLLQWQQV